MEAIHRSTNLPSYDSRLMPRSSPAPSAPSYPSGPHENPMSAIPVSPPHGYVPASMPMHHGPSASMAMPPGYGYTPGAVPPGYMYSFPPAGVPNITITNTNTAEGGSATANAASASAASAAAIVIKGYADFAKLLVLKPFVATIRLAKKGTYIVELEMESKSEGFLCCRHPVVKFQLTLYREGCFGRSLMGKDVLTYFEDTKNWSYESQDVTQKPGNRSVLEKFIGKEDVADTISLLIACSDYAV